MGVGSFATQVDNTFLVVLAICVVTLVGITIAMIWFMYRYHHTRNQEAKDIHGHLGLEVAWTLIPTVLVLSMFYFGMEGYTEMDRIPEDAFEVQATGRMWSWVFEYENGIQDTALRVPINRPVEVKLISNDVIHSLYIPAFRIKKDVVPGVDNRMWFSASEAGYFADAIACAEYCGDSHWNMYADLDVLPQAEFDAWYKSKGEEFAAMSKPAAPGEPSKVGLRGPMLFTLKGCNACHSVDGSPLVGPTLKGIFGKEEEVVFEDGTSKMITVDEDYLVRSIKEPNVEKVKGFENAIMVAQPLTEDELAEIIAYLKTL